MSDDKYYVLQHYQQSVYLSYDGTNIVPQNSFDYSCAVRLLYNNETGVLHIQQVCTNTYYQQLTNGARLTLGDNAVDYTAEFVSDNQAFRLRNNNQYLHRNGGNPIGVDLGYSGTFSQWKIWQVDLAEIDNPFANPVQITDVNTLDANGYYVLKNHGNQKYIYSTPEATNALGLKDSPDYSCVVRLIYNNDTQVLHILQVSTGTYYQQLINERCPTLGESPVDYTFNTDGVAENCFRLKNNNLYLNRDGGNTYPRALGTSLTGDYSQWEIYQVSKNLTLDEEKVAAATIEFNNGGTFDVTLNRNFVEGFNTVVLPFALTTEQVETVFGTEAEIYTYSETSTDENDVTVMFNRSTEEGIAANTPVLVKTTAASTGSKTLEGVTLVYNENPAVEGQFIDFTGVYTAQTVAEGDYFVNGNLYKSTGATTIKPFRAYLKVKEGVNPANVKLMIGGSTVTGLDSIDAAAETESEAVYNLLGQRVNKTQKGIYIVNGKKVVVK